MTLTIESGATTDHYGNWIPALAPLFGVRRNDENEVLGKLKVLLQLSGLT